MVEANIVDDNYLVLARKYRPSSFNTLIGQDALVRTMTNAISQNRIAHAFMLTGIRGVGKTTTARIIAKALNCVGSDGKGQATANPCNQCNHCVSIQEDRHPDILEMDAASHTGVNDVREIIENVRYHPVSARNKIYIIDEVHMLSNSAFNALLKTLEEPPPHVIFIFATTEIRKIPITILSRCQRFDLARVEGPTLIGHLQNIAKKESINIDDSALTLIANLSEGSVRDGLSLLDQLVTHTGKDTHISKEELYNLLGMGDRSSIINLFEYIAKGEIKPAINLLAEFYHQGIEIQAILKDLLDITHHITYANATGSITDTNFSKEATDRLVTLAQSLPVSFTSRMWQMLLKGLEEVNLAPNSYVAGEMILIRIAYGATLPTPQTLIQTPHKNKEQPMSKATAKKATQSEHINTPVVETGPVKTGTVKTGTVKTGTVETRAVETLLQKTDETASEKLSTNPIEENLIDQHKLSDFNDIIEICKDKSELIIWHHLQSDIHFVSLEDNHLTLRFTTEVPKEIASKLQRLLSKWTGDNWRVSLSEEIGTPTLHAQQAEVKQKEHDDTISHPKVQKVMDLFPGAQIKTINQLEEQS